MTVIRRTNPLGELIALRQAATQIAARLSRRPSRLAADGQRFTVDEPHGRTRPRESVQADRSSIPGRGS